MKEYPSILSATDLLARSGDYLGRPFVAFDKLDGSNIRAEWDRKKGWHRFGSRRRLLDPSLPLLGQAIRLIRTAILNRAMGQPTDFAAGTPTRILRDYRRRSSKGQLSLSRLS